MCHRRGVVVPLIVLSLSWAYAQDVVELSPDEIAVLGVGSAPGEIGRRIIEGNPFGGEPGSLVVSPEGELYVNDCANVRMNVYGREGGFLRAIDLSSTWEIRQANKYLITAEGKLVLPNFTYVGEVSEDGKLLYQVETGSISDSVKNSSAVWTFEGYVLFYDNDGNPRAIDPQGRLYSPKETRPIVLIMREGSAVRSIPEIRRLVDEFLEKSKLMLLGDQLLSKDLRRHQEYWRVLWSRAPLLSLAHRVYGWDNGNMGGILIGCDATGRTYWYINNPSKGERAILYVFSNRGEVLRMFRMNPLADAVAPNGDLYTFNLRFRPNAEYAIYRLDHQLIVPNVTLPAVIDGIVGKLSASSSLLAEPTDKNAYHPVKLLDGDAKTMWIENAKGPGIGESVTVGFDAPIITDEIQFMAGAFWKEYWKQNYRVKSLEVRLDDKVFTASFKDEMTVQSLKLTSPVTFKTAVFTIKDVYPSTKWEDTAISEITFYNQCAKVEVDYSKFKEFLKKAP